MNLAAENTPTRAKVVLGLWSQRMHPVLLPDFPPTRYPCCFDDATEGRAAHKTLDAITLVFCDEERFPALLHMRHTGALRFSTAVLSGKLSHDSGLQQRAMANGVLIVPLSLVAFAGRDESWPYRMTKLTSLNSDIALTILSHAGENGENGGYADGATVASPTCSSLPQRASPGDYTATDVTHAQLLARESGGGMQHLRPWDCLVTLSNSCTQQSEIRHLAWCIGARCRLGFIGAQVAWGEGMDAVWQDIQAMKPTLIVGGRQAIASLQSKVDSIEKSLAKFNSEGKAFPPLVRSTVRSLFGSNVRCLILVGGDVPVEYHQRLAEVFGDPIHPVPEVLDTVRTCASDRAREAGATPKQGVEASGSSPRRLEVLSRTFGKPDRQLSPRDGEPDRQLSPILSRQFFKRVDRETFKVEVETQTDNESRACAAGGEGSGETRPAARTAVGGGGMRNGQLGKHAGHTLV